MSTASWIWLLLMVLVGVMLGLSIRRVARPQNGKRTGGIIGTVLWGTAALVLLVPLGWSVFLSQTGYGMPTVHEPLLTHRGEQYAMYYSDDNRTGTVTNTLKVDGKTRRVRDMLIQQESFSGEIVPNAKARYYLQTAFLDKYLPGTQVQSAGEGSVRFSLRYLDCTVADGTLTVTREDGMQYTYPCDSFSEDGKTYIELTDELERRLGFSRFYGYQLRMEGHFVTYVNYRVTTAARREYVENAYGGIYTYTYQGGEVLDTPPGTVIATNDQGAHIWHGDGLPALYYIEEDEYWYPLTLSDAITFDDEEWK